LLAAYVVLTLPLVAESLFPKVWVLFALFVWVGRPCWREMPRRLALTAVAGVVLVSLFVARQHMASYALEPAQRFEHFAVQNGEVFSSFPAVSRAGIFCQSIGGSGYVLRRLHDGASELIFFQGQALHPRTSPDGASVDVELLANRTSTMMRFDPVTGMSTALGMPVPADSAVSAVSPDGKWMAFESAQDGPIHIWLRDLKSGQQKRLAGGDCNSTSPAWESDSKAIIFASDCQRAFGMPTLYRAPVTTYERPGR
jgi:hypothetical protein